MRKSIFIVLLIIHHALIGQIINRVEVHGVVFAITNEVEAVAIYNTTSQKGTVTNEKGAFVLEVAEYDMIQVSALQFESKTIIITKDVIESKSLKIYLEEHVNKLAEVTVGNKLTGDLLKDIKNVEGKPPINFYDVGIPGFTGKMATQSERMLFAAGEFKPSMLLGILLGSGSLDPIINGLSGRTKMLKDRVKFEEREALIQSIKSRLAEDFFKLNPLEDNLRMEFFYFCADDVNFIKMCRNQTDFEILKFLGIKYTQFVKNRNETED